MEGVADQFSDAVVRAVSLWNDGRDSADELTICEVEGVRGTLTGVLNGEHRRLLLQYDPVRASVRITEQFASRDSFSVACSPEIDASHVLELLSRVWSKLDQDTTIPTPSQRASSSSSAACSSLGDEEDDPYGGGEDELYGGGEDDLYGGSASALAEASSEPHMSRGERYIHEVAPVVNKMLQSSPWSDVYGGGLLRARQRHGLALLSTLHARTAALCLAEAVSKDLHCSRDVGLGVLRRSGWDMLTIEDEMAAGVSGGVTAPAVFPGAGTDCAICYGSIGRAEDGYALPCNHWFCRECWQEHCAACVNSGEALAAQCPMDGCSQHIDDATFDEFLDERLMGVYSRMWVKDLAKGELFQTCRSADCDVVASFPLPLTRNVQCACSEFYCIDCGERGHAPLPCEFTEMWCVKERKAKDPESGRLDSSLKGKIKPCPSCKVPTEKNDGCQYMMCRSCKTPWCWVCGQFGPKIHHVYACNDTPDEKWLRAASSTMFSEDGRFDWHLERFDNHMSSLQFAEGRLQHCTKRAASLVAQGMVPAQANFLVEAAHLLVHCRHVCAWTYAMGYFLTEGRSRSVLAFAQRDLEMYTEQLSEKVERHSVSQLLEQSTSIMSLMSALQTFCVSMERWAPPDVSEMVSLREIEEALKREAAVEGATASRSKRARSPKSAAKGDAPKRAVKGRTKKAK
jgi:hypothetical protein